MIYLDNAATTKPDERVIAEMMPYLKGQYGNPGSVYSFGAKAREAVENARSQVAEMIGAKPEQIIFTSGGTEANNIALRATSNYIKSKRKNQIVVSPIEHDSIINCAEHLDRNKIVKVRYPDVSPNGVVSLSSVERCVNKKTGLVSVMYINNETGVENPVKDIGVLCRDKGVLFHTDCVQAASYRQIDVDEIQCDLLSLSSHKLYAPKGIGALYVRDKSILSPFILGGSFQEFGVRSGTENVAGIVGFGKACELMRLNIKNEEMSVYNLRRAFIAELSRKIGNIYINGNRDAHSKIINLRIDNLDGETLVLMLDSLGVMVSAGSACRSLESEPSRVLTAMGISAEDARNSIRVSFSKYNTLEEVEEAANLIVKCVNAIRNSSSISQVIVNKTINK